MKSKQLSISLSILSFLFFIFSLYIYKNWFNIRCVFEYPGEEMADSKLFIHKQGVCFIYRKLGGGNREYTDISEVLEQEYFALENAGLIGFDSNSSQKGTKFFDPTENILINNTRNLSKEKISEILEEEINYMKFLGIVKTNETE